MKINWGRVGASIYLSFLIIVAIFVIGLLIQTLGSLIVYWPFLAIIIALAAIIYVILDRYDS